MSTSARIKRQLALRGGVLAIVLVVLGLAAIAGAGYVYTNPPVEEIPPEETNVQQFETSVDTIATVTGETPLYNQSETLRNLPVYFTNVSSNLTLSIQSSVPAEQPVNLTHRLTLYQEATRDGTVFWDRTRVLAAEDRTVTTGALRTNTTVNVSALSDDIGRIESAIGGVGALATEVRLTVTYESDSYSGELTSSSPINIAENAYWLQSELSASQTQSQTTGGGTRQLSPDMTLVGGLAILGLLLLAGGVALALWSSRGVDVYELEMEVYRSQYDEWISEGEFPTGSNKQYIYISSIEDLVDVAIDTGKRVIYDPDLETYNVVDGDLIYYHAEDPTRVDSWLNFSSEDGD